MNQENFDNTPVKIFSRVGGKDDAPDLKGHKYPYYLGVELELENVRGPADREFTPPPLRNWTQHQDDSLRNGIEFVTEIPLAGDDLIKTIENFYAQNYRYTGGPRTSTHVHMNAGDLTVGAVRTMFVLSYILEDALFRILEAKRKWCGYCMPLTEMAPHRIRSLLASTNTAEFERSMIGHNTEKYYGFNVNSIRKHGTVEFRYFPGAPSKDELYDWLDYCTTIKRAGLTTTMEELAAIPDAASLGLFLSDRLGRWGARAVNSVGEQSLFDFLAEVMAYIPVMENNIRRDELVFMSRPLLSYVANRYCKTDEQRAWLLPRFQKLQVITANEWYTLMEESVLHAHPKKQVKNKIQENPYFDPPEGARNLQAVYEDFVQQVIAPAPRPAPAVRRNPAEADLRRRMNDIAAGLRRPGQV